MKLKYIYFLLFCMSNYLSAQTPTTIVVPQQVQQMAVYNHVRLMEKAINDNDSQIINSLIENKSAISKNVNEFNPNGANIDSKVDIKVNSITVKGDTAVVNCNYQLYNDFGISKKTEDIILVKKRNEWEFTALENLNKAVNNTLKNRPLMQSAKKSVSASVQAGTQYNLVNLRYSDDVFVRYPFTTTGTYEINSDVTYSNLNRQLFGYDANIDFALYFKDLNNDNKFDRVQFCLDPKWKRIVYTREIYGTYGDIRSYGDHANEIKFFDPIAIDVNEFGEVFVADHYAGKIIKLQYNSSTNLLETTSGFNINPNNISEPMDIDYSSNLTNFDKSDDFILVTDEWRKSILKFDVYGNLLDEFKTYNVESSNYNISYPTRLVSLGNQIQFIDKSRNLIISGNMGTGSILCYSTPSKLPDISQPADIGLDASLNLIVADASLDIIHKFDFYGNYICSYRGSDGLFDIPKIVSNGLQALPGYFLLDFVTIDSWGPTKGMKKFLPGADAFNLEKIEYPTYYEFKCMFSDIVDYKFELIRTSDNSVISSETEFTSFGGINESFLINKDQLVNNLQYKWKVSFISGFDDLYENYSQGWKSKEIFFTANAPIPQGTLPSQITTNSMLYGTYICQGTTISNNATLTILPGTTIKLKPNKGIVVNSGSKIIANGTASEPIIFERKDICSGPPLPKSAKANSLLELPGDDCSWLSVNLEGDNNQFTYCIFDGGTDNVSVQSNNNSFSHCTFKNAIRGISSYSFNGGSWGSYSLDNCLIEDNTYGVVANSVYAEITNTEIKNNEEYGIYLYNARLGQNTGSGGLFTHNYVHDNGTYGVRIDYNGQLWLGYGTVKGNNKICNNGSHEIYISSSSSSSRLYQSSYFEAGGYGGYSDIYDTELGFYVYNLAQTYNGENYISLTQHAENDYWNTMSTPSQYRFYGSVDRSPAKFASQYVPPPSPLIVSDESSDLKQLVTAGMVKSIGESIDDEGKLGGLIDIKQKILDLKSYIRNNPDCLINARFLKELYSIQINEDPTNSLNEKQSILDLIKERRMSLESSFGSKSIKKSTQLIGEVAMILETDELINNKQFKEALEKINNNVKYIKNDDNKRETLLQKLNVYEELRDYENALSTLLELEEIVKHFEKGIIYTVPEYEIIKSNLKERIGSSEKVLLVKASNSFPSSETNAPLTYSLYQNYPNPFNPSTTISFALPEPSSVTIDIYSITGELVRHLADRNYESGIHNINFDAGNYSSGIYLVQVRMNSLSNSNETHSFTKKIVLLK